MGMTWHSVKFLAKARRENIEFGKTVMLGRQELHTSVEKVRQIFLEHGISFSIDDKQLRTVPKYGEPIFYALGANKVDSMDVSEYENATIIADLNGTIPDELKEKYDLVFDGGTLEHVFDVKQALYNVMSLPKIGGRVAIHTMANNYLGHGFYQFSPELFHRVFSPDNGYIVETMILHEEFEFARWYDVPDPIEVQERIELANNTIGIALLVLARRTEIVPLFRKTPQQSDYSSLWRERIFAAAANTENVSTRPTTMQRREYIQALKPLLPLLVRMKHRLMWKYPAVPRYFNKLKNLKFKQRDFSLEKQSNKFRKIL